MSLTPVNSLPLNPLLEQFLSEARDLLEAAAKKLMQLEDSPNDQVILNELFRCVHTLKGNSGLFTFPEMTRVLHAGEDLLGMVRSGHRVYSRELADRLLEAMDYVGLLLSEVETTEKIGAPRALESQLMAEALRKLMPSVTANEDTAAVTASNGPNSLAANAQTSLGDDSSSMLPQLTAIPEAVLRAALAECRQGDQLHWIAYRPQRECFFHGDDPLHIARQTPGLMWGRVFAPEPLPSLGELDTYSCLLGFDLLANVPREELDEYYRYLPDQVKITAVAALWLAEGQDKTNRPSNAASVRNPAQPLSGDDEDAYQKILAAQRQVLLLDDRPAWHAGRLRATAEVLANLSQAGGETSGRPDIQAALDESLTSGHNTVLLAWLDAWLAAHENIRPMASMPCVPGTEGRIATAQAEGTADAGHPPESNPEKVTADDGLKFGRRTEDSLTGPRSLKVDQAKIDRLMNLIGELVVEKNSLPYLARAGGGAIRRPRNFA